ncbi:MAG TPA: FtsX-like permease family protein [Streptosporangiaceae bacterium]|jgi:hypothetical protein
MARFPAALRHVAAHRLAFAVTGLTVVITTGSAATAAGFATATTGAAVHHALLSTSSSSILVTAPATSATVAADGRQVAAALSSASRGLPLTTWASAWSRPLNLPRPATARTQPQVQVASLPALAGHARLISGTWPSAGAAGAPVSVAVPAPAARLLHLHPGQLLTARDSLSGTQVKIQVSGVFTPVTPHGSYWRLDSLGPAAVSTEAGFTSYGPLIAAPAAFSHGQVAAAGGTWLAVPRVRRITAPDLAVLASHLTAADGGLTNSLGAVVSTRLPALLEGLAAALLVARSQLLIGLLILLVIAGATLVVAVRLLGSQRAGTGPLLMARGASRRQLARRGAAEAAALVIPAAIIGPLLAGLAMPLLTQYGPLAAARISVGHISPLIAWLASVIVAGYSGLIIALPWLRQPDSPLSQRTARSRQRTLTATASAGADLGLVVIAAVAGWQLTQGSALGATAIGVNPVLAVAPVLALAAGTLVMLRVLPVIARLGDRAARRGRGLTLAAAAWQVGRRPLQQGGPALLAVLTVATSVLALATASSWRRSVTEQAGFTVGASTRITTPPAAPLRIGQVAAVAAARGVTASSPAYRAQISLPSGTGSGTVLALNGAAAARIVPADSMPSQGSTGADSSGSGPGGSGRASRARATTSMLRQLGGPAGPVGSLLPGRPGVLVLSARLSRAPTTDSQLAVQLTDAVGVGYVISAGSLPADGRVHQLRVPIAPGTDFPVRLHGFSFQYQMPMRHPVPAALTIRVAAGPVAGPDRPVPAPGALVNAVSAPAAGPNAVTPDITSAAPVHGALAVRFRTGSGELVSGQPQRAWATLTIGAGPHLPELTGIATRAFLAATSRRVGTTISVPIQGVPMQIRLAGVVARFPTITGADGGLIVDQAALQDTLMQAGIQPVADNEWWLRDLATPRITGLPPGSSVLSDTGVAAALRGQPLTAAGLEELLAVAAIGLLLAGAGFAAGVAAGRDRQRDTALLDALGARRRQLAALLSLEQAMLAVPAAAAGLLLGMLLAHLVIPAVTLTAQATHPVPPVTVSLPLLPAVLVAVAVAAVPPLAAAISGMRRLRVAAMLRVETET